MKDFSIVLVSRSRPKMMKDLYRSIVKTSLMDNEVLIGLDYDDFKLKEYKSLESYDNVTLDVDFRNRNLHRRINQLLGKTKGRYIFVLNDDCLLVEKGWDRAAYDILDNFGNIVYGRTYDNSIDRVDDKYAAFPIVSRDAANRLGFIMDESFGNHGSDVVTYRIYEKAKKVVDLKCVQIDHIFHNSEQALSNRSNDSTAVEMVERTFSSGFSVGMLFNKDVTLDAEKLKNE